MRATAERVRRIYERAARACGTQSTRKEYGPEQREESHRPPLATVLAEMPNAGEDSDFERRND